MTKSELALFLVEQYGYTHKAAKTIIDAIFDRIRAALLNGDNVQILGFGTFSVKTRQARNGRNPRTGEAIQLPEMRRVRFKQGKSLKEALNK